MSDPVTLAGVCIALTEHLAGHIAHEKFQELIRHVCERIPGLSGLPVNHDIARAVRTAQLQAFNRVLRDYEKSKKRSEWQDDVADAPWFQRAMSFVRSQLTLVGEIKVSGALGMEHSIQAGTGTIHAALDEYRSGPGSYYEPSRRLAEDAVLDELRHELNGTVIPADFERRFRGEEPEVAGWFGLFSAYLAEQVKVNGRFRRILLFDILGDLTQFGLEQRDVLRAFGETLDCVGTSQRRTEGKVDAIYALLERFVMERGLAVASETGMPLPTLRAILVAFGEQQADEEIDASQIEQFLRRRADEYRLLKAQLERLSNDDSSLLRARREAQQAIVDGRFDTAREILLDTLRRQRADRVEEDKLVRQKRRSEAETCAALANLA